jgi:threonine/homoserine/homoserine lactone efflux protein
VTRALVAGLLAGYAIALPVGPVAAYLVSLTARTSLRVGAAAALGVATVDGLYALAAAVGGDALSVGIARVSGPLQAASAVILLSIALRAVLSAVRRYRAGQPSAGNGVAGPVQGTPLRAFAGLVGITVVNPATFAYFAALVAGTSGRAMTSPAALPLFAVAAWAASASWQLILACGGALAARAFTGTRGQLITTVGSSLLIIVLAIRLLASAWP